jgi:hypothetical protein
VKTGYIEAVRVLLGHTKIESTARYLRIAKRSEPDRNFSSLRYLTPLADIAFLVGTTSVSVLSGGGADGLLSDQERSFGAPIRCAHLVD